MATGNYTNVKIISVSKLPTWVKEHSHNPENFKNPRYKGVKCVYVQAEGSFEEHDYAPNTFYMAMGTFTSGKSQFFRTFANDLDDNPKYYFQPGEIEAMKANAESRAMDRAQGLGGMF
jgi:CRISPR/Cas system endoribonuclease Cas6 (RAMP superfamily)